MRECMAYPLQTEGMSALFDGHHVPGRLNAALEFVSKKMSRKGAQITLMVMRKEYQFPSHARPQLPQQPGFCLSLPAKTYVPAAHPPSCALSPLQPTKQLVRPRDTMVGPATNSRDAAIASPTFSLGSVASVSTANSPATSSCSYEQTRRSVFSPTSPGVGPILPTPATPYTSTTSTTPPAYYPCEEPGICLVYAHPPSPRDAHLLAQSLAKAARRFAIPRPDLWLPAPIFASQLDLPRNAGHEHLVRRCLDQGEVIFSTPAVTGGLTLLSPHRLYAFKTALAGYAQTRDASRLENAVNELRTLVLQGGEDEVCDGCRVRESVLRSQCAWLEGVDDTAAVRDVCRMYARAYDDEGIVMDDEAWRSGANWSLPDGAPLLLAPEFLVRGADDQERDTSQVTHASLNARGWVEDEILLEVVRSEVDGAEDTEVMVMAVRMVIEIGDDMADRCWGGWSSSPYGELDVAVGVDEKDKAEMEIPLVMEETPIPAPPLESKPALPAVLAPVPTKATSPPVLRIQTSFSHLKPKPNPAVAVVSIEDVVDDDLDVASACLDGDKENKQMRGPTAITSPTTLARVPISAATPPQQHQHPSSRTCITIDELLSPLSTVRDSIGGGNTEGPMTPNAHGDISPVTRIEWAFLMGGGGDAKMGFGVGARTTVVVET